MSHRKTKASPASAQVRALHNAVLSDVLKALHDVWGLNDDRVPRHPPRLKDLSLLEQADSVLNWLEGARRFLLDAERPRRHRFALAWSLSPATCVGQDVDDVVIRAVDAVVAENVKNLQRLTEPLRDGRADTATRDRLRALVAQCVAPARPPDEWIYLVEAIRAGAEDLPVLIDAFQPGSEAMSIGAVDPAPFVALVLESVCPGTASALDADTLRAAVRMWGQRTPRGQESVWDCIAKLLHPAPWERVSAPLMRRRWNQAGPRVRLVRGDLLLTLQAQLLARGRIDLVFAPSEAFTPVWVDMLMVSVRAAMPKRKIDADAKNTPLDATSLPLPDSFVSRAAQLLPSERAGRRGRPSVPVASVLTGLLDHLNSPSRAWRELPHGSAIEKRHKELTSAGHLDAFVELAREFGLIRVPPGSTSSSSSGR